MEHNLSSIFIIHPFSRLRFPPFPTIQPSTFHLFHSFSRLPFPYSASLPFPPSTFYLLPFTFFILYSLIPIPSFNSPFFDFRSPYSVSVPFPPSTVPPFTFFILFPVSRLRFPPFPTFQPSTFYLLPFTFYPLPFTFLNS